MTEPRIDTSIRLPDGRTLAFAEYGEPHGAPVLLFHGLPGSRLSWSMLPGDPFPPGLRVIAPDRPGFGNSSPDPDRRLIDWAGDVAGAAPSDAPGVFEEMSSVNRFFMKLALRAPWLSALNTRLVAAVVRRWPGRYIHAMQRKPHANDRAVLGQPGIRDMLVRDFTEALRQGGQGMIDDMAANHGGSWRFDLTEIRADVFFWYGAKDRSVSTGMGRYLADAVPSAQFTLLADAGHLWALVNLHQVLETVMRPLVSASK